MAWFLIHFAGGGTTIHASQKLGRKWIDVRHLAISLIEKRLKDAFPGITFQVNGTPKDLDGARALADLDKYQFQWWAAVSLVDAVPYGGKKKGADSGIDGFTPCHAAPPTTERGQGSRNPFGKFICLDVWIGTGSIRLDSTS
jgi:site-specific DNA-methyltransferase (adenine-specific)